jgi:hypothetical protein
VTDTERLDKLEKLIWSDRVGNGVALFPCLNAVSKKKGVTIDDLGDQDGSDLGESLTLTCPNLREAIDNL